MRFERRLRALETRMTADPVILFFADGSTAKICCRRDYLLDLLVGANDQANLSPQRAAHLELIFKSVGAKEPGGGHMVEVLKSMLDRPSRDLSSRLDDSE
jgi:hypothetical protein